MWSTIHYRRNEIILRAGMPAEKIYYLVKGSIELSSEYEMPETLQAGDVFGDLTLSHQSPVTFTALSKNDVVLKEIPKEHFLESIGNEPELAKIVMKHLLHQYSKARERLQELEANTTHNRIMQMTTKHHQQKQIVLRGLSSRAKEALNNRELVIDQFPFLFCRKPDTPGPLAYMNNYLLLEDDAPYEISKNHCKIITRDQNIYITDNASRFGTLIDGKSIGRKFSCQEHELSSGAHKIYLGSSTRCLYAFALLIN